MELRELAASCRKAAGMASAGPLRAGLEEAAGELESRLPAHSGAPTAVDVPALMKEHVRLGADLRELTGIHERLLAEVLRNASEDIRGGDEAAEYLAEHYVRALEAEVQRLTARVAALNVPAGDTIFRVISELGVIAEARDFCGYVPQAGDMIAMADRDGNGLGEMPVIEVVHRLLTRTGPQHYEVPDETVIEVRV